jgi:hypothetical protein
MKQRNGKVLCAAHGCQRIATCKLTLPARSNGSQPYPLYTCLEHARSVQSLRVVSFEHGFTVMMDFSPYFKDVAESS